jgi:hypothetical protein
MSRNSQRGAAHPVQKIHYWPVVKLSTPVPPSKSSPDTGTMHCTIPPLSEPHYKTKTVAGIGILPRPPQCPLIPTPSSFPPSQSRNTSSRQRGMSAAMPSSCAISTPPAPLSEPLISPLRTPRHHHRLTQIRQCRSNGILSRAILHYDPHGGKQRKCLAAGYPRVPHVHVLHRRYSGRDILVYRVVGILLGNRDGESVG